MKQISVEAQANQTQPHVKEMCVHDIVHVVSKAYGFKKPGDVMYDNRHMCNFMQGTMGKLGRLNGQTEQVTHVNTCTISFPGHKHK